MPSVAAWGGKVAQKLTPVPSIPPLGLVGHLQYVLDATKFVVHPRISKEPMSFTHLTRIRKCYFGGTRTTQTASGRFPLSLLNNHLVLVRLWK